MNKTDYKIGASNGAGAGAARGETVRAGTNCLVEQAVGRLYRSHYGKMVANILSRYPDLGLETAEDLVQDAFAVALTEWARDGIPNNPPGWIYVVIRNRAINRLKAD